MQVAQKYRRYEGTVWRCVEAQHRISTMRLVDSVAEQHLLENVLESTKPAIPEVVGGRHFLIATPFRYSPDRLGSRFRRFQQKEGVFYAAEEVNTALCETAFYRFLFFAQTSSKKFPRNPVEHSVFSVFCKASKALDISCPPLRDVKYESLSDYSACQALADTARADGVQLIRYTSVRDPLARANIAVLDAASIVNNEPQATQSWRTVLYADRIVALCEAPRQTLEFPVSMFQEDKRLGPLTARA